MRGTELRKESWIEFLDDEDHAGARRHSRGRTNEGCEEPIDPFEIHCAFVVKAEKNLCELPVVFIGRWVRVHISFHTQPSCTVLSCLSFEARCGDRDTLLA